MRTVTVILGSVSAIAMVGGVMGIVEGGRCVGGVEVKFRLACTGRRLLS